MFTRDELVKMSLDNLSRMRDLIVSVIGEKEQAKLDSFRKEIESRAKKAGIDLAAFLAVTSGAKVAPKYRNPANASETWTGRGREPLWIKGKSETARKAMLIQTAPATPAEAPKTPEAPTAETPKAA